MANEGVDRRVQRTRRLLSQALVSLVLEKGYEAITVQDIIDRANLGRSTFYSHYDNKEDLLLSQMGRLVHNLIGHVENASPADEKAGGRDRVLMALPLFRHTQEQHRLYKAMVGGRGIDVVIEGIHTHLREHIQEQIEQLLLDGQTSSVPPPVMADYLAGALLTLLTWWLDNDMPYPPQRMDEMFQQLTMPGVWAALGITP